MLQDALQGQPVRIITPLGGDRLLVTLTKEGGIGKTTIALATVDWAHERQSFPGGIFELAREHLASDQALLTDLLACSACLTKLRRVIS